MPAVKIIMQCKLKVILQSICTINQKEIQVNLIKQIDRLFIIYFCVFLNANQIPHFPCYSTFIKVF